MNWRFVTLLACLAPILAGCVTTAQNALSPADAKTFRLAEVRVTVPAEATIVGYDALTTEYAAAKQIPNYELNAATETDEAKAWTSQSSAGAREERNGKAVGCDAAGPKAGPR